MAVEDIADLVEVHRMAAAEDMGYEKELRMAVAVEEDSLDCIGLVVDLEVGDNLLTVHNPEVEQEKNRSSAEVGILGEGSLEEGIAVAEAVGMEAAGTLLLKS